MHILTNMYDCKCPVKTKKTICNRNNMNKRYCFCTGYKFVRFSDLSTRRQLPGTSKCYYRQITVIKTTRNVMLKLFYCARKGDKNKIDKSTCENKQFYFLINVFLLIFFVCFLFLLQYRIFHKHVIVRWLSRYCVMNSFINLSIATMENVYILTIIKINFNE